MTREEIIEQLNLAIDLIKQDGKDWLDNRDIPMLEECVKALSQEPCADAISREAIIQTLNKMDRYTANELTLCDTDKKFPANEVFIVDDVYEEIAEQLSSIAQPVDCDKCDPYNKGFDEGLEQGFRAIGAEVRQDGEWIKMPIGFKCSNCNELEDRTTKYCPNCGAKMFKPQGRSE